MFQMVFFLVFILVSSLLLANESQNLPSKDTIRCEIVGGENKIYLFDLNAQKYSVSLLESGRAKASLSRQIQHYKPVVKFEQFHEYQFEMDDHNKAIIKMDVNGKTGRGELIQAVSGGRVKSFTKCERIK